MGSDVFVTKEDLRTAFDDFEQKITKQHEIRVQAISGHYLKVEKSNQDLEKRVCNTFENLDKKLSCIEVKLNALQPVQDGLNVLASSRKFAVWLAPLTIFGVVASAVGVFIKRLFQ